MIAVVAAPRARVAQLMLRKPFTRPPHALTLPHALLHLALALHFLRLSVVVLAAFCFPNANASSTTCPGTSTINPTWRPFMHADLGGCPGEPEPKLDRTLFPLTRASASA